MSRGWKERERRIGGVEYRSEIKKEKRGEKLRPKKRVCLSGRRICLLWVSWVCDALPATLLSAARGRRNSVLAAGSRGGKRMGRGRTRHGLFGLEKILETEREL